MQLRRRIPVAIFSWLILFNGAWAFRSAVLPANGRTTFPPSPSTHLATGQKHSSRKPSSTSLNMFMGSDGGLLGVGGPEVFTILLVGYFVLGPSDLYKLVKEIGKFIQNIRTLGTDLSTTFEANMASQIEIEELRKAQQDLTDAFSFRRSINVDDSEAFATTTTSPRVDESAAEVATVGTGAPSRKKKRIRVKKKSKDESPETAAASVPPFSTESAVSNIPDLVAPERPTDPFISQTMSEMTKEEQEEVEREFEKYANIGDPVSRSWDKDNAEIKDAEARAKDVSDSTEDQAAARTRFQQQMSNGWNEQILENEDKLSPLAKVMEMLAVLEKEKMSKTQLLEEEFRKRAEMDEEYYKKQRKILEDAAAQVQKDAYKIP